MTTEDQALTKREIASRWVSRGSEWRDALNERRVLSRLGENPPAVEFPTGSAAMEELRDYAEARLGQSLGDLDMQVLNVAQEHLWGFALDAIWALLDVVYDDPDAPFDDSPLGGG